MARRVRVNIDNLLTPYMIDGAGRRLAKIRWSKHVILKLLRRLIVEAPRWDDPIPLFRTRKRDERA